MTNSGLTLSEKYLPEYKYVNLGATLAAFLKDEDLSSRFLPMKAWDYLKFIMNKGTVNGALALENLTILFEPALRISMSAFLKEAMTGRGVILKIEHKVSEDYRYYPFPDDKSFFLDLTGIDTTTR
ncbi:MAG: hypothetical protein J6N46_02535 [Bacteroidales bacterium]|nr:hypothetical protein [Bacteroidales bacterium]